jgi:hypothetical protein
MDIYSVGPDDLSLSDLNDINHDDFKYLIYWYYNYGYEGEGEALALDNNGNFYHKDLAHCSCYGCMENFYDNSDIVTLEQLLSDNDNIHSFECKQEIKSKLKELLSLCTSVIF